MYGFLRRRLLGRNFHRTQYSVWIRTTRRETSCSKTSLQSAQKSKTTSFKVNKASSSGLSSKGTHSKRKLDSHINEELEKAQKLATEWELNMDKTYSEEQSISILNIVSYHSNIDSGYRQANDERLYKLELKKDTTRVLFNEAMRGLELERRWRKIHEEVLELTYSKHRKL